MTPLMEYSREFPPLNSPLGVIGVIVVAMALAAWFRIVRRKP